LELDRAQADAQLLLAGEVAARAGRLGRPRLAGGRAPAVVAVLEVDVAHARAVGAAGAPRALRVRLAHGRPVPVHAELAAELEPARRVEAGGIAVVEEVGL